MQSPYVIVGGRLAAQIRRAPGDECSFSISNDGENWKPIDIVLAKSEKPSEVSLDEFFPSQGEPVYHYWLRMEMRAGSKMDQVGLERIRIENDLQMATLSLPALEVGSSQIVYRDETREPHQVRVTFEWLERSTSRAPAAPAAALFPADGAKVKGTKFRFQWAEGRDPDGGPIADYHFQLSDEGSLRWVLSSNFDKLVSNTADRGSASYTVPYEGLLNPGQRYYWRVRARDEKGVWSDWSKEWSFEVEAAGVPLAVQLEEDEEGFALKWKENPQGLKPVRYEIYRSNEKGFSVSDKPYEVNVGSQKPVNRKVTFPHNLLTSSSATSLILKPEHAFYRVVAVDENGNKSGPSDYVSAPRPLVYSTPPTEARVGKEYRYEIKTIQAIGDLRCRIQEDDSYHDTYCDYAFWNKEKPNFSLVEESPICGWRDAAWLKLDPKNGLLSGIPQKEDIDEYQVNIVVEIEGQGRELQSFVLKVLP